MGPKQRALGSSANGAESDAGNGYGRPGTVTRPVVVNRGEIMTKVTEISPTAGIPTVEAPIKGTLQIPYVIVRHIRLDGEWTAGMVYGPYDQQGASAAYKVLVEAGLNDGPDCKLEIRGLWPTSHARNLEVSPTGRI
jgi:hypothetical protein